MHNRIGHTTQNTKTLVSDPPRQISSGSNTVTMIWRIELCFEVSIAHSLPTQLDIATLNLVPIDSDEGTF